MSRYENIIRISAELNVTNKLSVTNRGEAHSMYTCSIVRGTSVDPTSHAQCDGRPMCSDKDVTVADNGPTQLKTV